MATPTPQYAGHTSKQTHKLLSLDIVHQGRYSGGMHLQNVPLGPPPQVGTQDHIHKAHPGHPSLCPPYAQVTAQTHTGPAKRLCVRKGRCMYPPLGGFPEPGDREECGREPLPPKARRMRTHCLGNILHGVRPQPAHYRARGGGGGAPTSQAGLTQGRRMRGEGTAVQVALLRTPPPPAPV